MPLYEYTCRDCGGQFEALRSMRAADEPIICPRCGGRSTFRLLSRFFAHSSGESQASGATSGGGCGSCSGGSCGTCRH